MPSTKKVAVGGVVALLFVGLLFFTFFLPQSRFQPLYNQLRPEYAGEVAAFLRDNDIPYKVADDGSTILVPSDKVHEVRLQLASNGLPRGGVVGMELWDRVGIGETEFDRRVKYVRALQGELTRTILEIDSVENARVHIALPEQSLFTQAERPATASVFVECRPGTSLSLEQIRAIAHLMATSVEGLSPDRVTIIDNRGNVLSDGLAGPQDGSVAGVGGTQSALSRFQVERAFEKELEQSLQAMLERVFGYGKVVLRVNASLNLDYQEENLELHEPVLDESGLVISEQESSERSSAAGPAGGVPGVAANVPGYAADAAQGVGEYRREDITRNYVVNRKESRVVRAPGRVERLSVAVWLDGNIPSAQRQMVEEMIASAVGLQPQRGDTVTVGFMDFEDSFFAEASGPLQEAVPRQPLSTWALAAAFVVALFLLLLMGRRRRRRAQPVPAPVVDVTVGGEPEQEAPLSPQERAKQRAQEVITEMAQKDPEAFVALLRAWLDEE